MGWSCAAAAGNTMRAWVDACVASTGQSNVFVTKGERFFWEESRTEHRDGAITGTVFKMLPTELEGRCLARKVASFRINPDGTVARAPAFLKAIRGDERSAGFGVGSGGLR